MPRPFLTSIDLTQNKLIGLAPGTNPTDGVNKSQLDAAVNGLDPKASCRAATTGNVTLSGLQTIDGVALNAGDRVLVRNQTNAAQNGIYVASASAWSLATDFTQGSVSAGAQTVIEEGSTLAGSFWYLITPNPITVGTTALTFNQVNKPFNPTNGNGILISGTQIAIDPTVVARKFAQNIGDGTATSFIVTHNLNTLDIQTTVYRNTTPFDDVIVDVQHTSVNSITVLFAIAPAANAYRVVVVG